MCGIAGIIALNSDKRISAVERSELAGMLSLINNRGPDGFGFWSDSYSNVLFGHVRLSIIDLALGKQPMVDTNSNLAITFNGEIYNFLELKKTYLTSYPFKTNSDTEVILALYDKFGEDFPKYLRGMFALAIYDGKKNKVILARDHIGKKPLFYFKSNDHIYFSSEYKSFLEVQAFKPEMDLESVHYFLNLRWVPGNRCLLKSLQQVSPGEILIIENGKEKLKKYWTLNPTTGQSELFNQKSLLEGLDHYIDQAVKRRLIADVPVGLFLSGGLDSSAILHYAKKKSNANISTFTFGFNQPNDELVEAKETADYYHSDHTEMVITESPFQFFSEAIWHCETPKVNSVQVYLLSKYASKKIKVVLSGLGGDELFGGYDNYLFAKVLNPFVSLPFKSIGNTLRNISYTFFTKSFDFKKDELRRGAELVLSFGNKANFYSVLRNVWDVNSSVYSDINIMRT
ncbi:MAG: asparagine synthase (glutamine-hydrolyzing) [Bacteriovoracaceae bacterium]